MNEGYDRWLGKFALAAIVAAIYAIARTQQRARDGGTETYRYHPLLPALVGLGGAALLWMGQDVLAQVTDPDVRVVLNALFGFAAGTAAIVTVYLARYRVRIDAMTIEYGAFTHETVPLAEIVDCDFGPGDRPDLLLYHRDGRRTSIPSLIGEFDVLVKRFKAHCEQLALAGAAEPSRKLADRARRKRRRLIGWGLLGTIVLLAVAFAIITRD